MVVRAVTPPAILLALLAITTGCMGGSGADISAGGVKPPIELDDPDPGGVWSDGTITIHLDTTVDWPVLEITGVSTSSGEMRFVDEQGTSYVAQVDTRKFQWDGTSDTFQDFSGTITEFAAPGSQLADGGTVVKGQITGSIYSDGCLNASIDPDEGGFRNIWTCYDALYERDSDLARVSGTWRDPSRNTFTIDETGAMFGQDSSGCVYDGAVSIIDSAFNVYRVTVGLSNCADRDRAYAGLAVVDDLLAAGDGRKLVMNTNNTDVAALTMVLEKL